MRNNNANLRESPDDEEEVELDREYLRRRSRDLLRLYALRLKRKLKFRISLKRFQLKRC